MPDSPPTPCRISSTYGRANKGGLPEHQNCMILAILNFCVAPMPPSNQVSAQSHLQFGRRCPLKIINGRHGSHLRYQHRMILAILKKRKFGPNASHQDWAKSDLEFGSRWGFKIFKMTG